MQLYSNKVLEYFRNPKNLGEIKNPDGIATVGNPVCGDVMKMFIKVKGNKISAIKFQTLGCAAAIATSSVVTEMVKGKTLWEAKMIKEGEVIKSLGGLPKQKIHCSVLAVRALKQAIENYENKQH
jgi:nitrogen fixation NifU-like protein